MTQTDSKLIYHILWLLTHDRGFYRQGFADLLMPSYFDDRTVRWVVRQAKKFWHSNRQPMTRPSIDLILEQTDASGMERSKTTINDVEKCLTLVEEKYGVTEEMMPQVLDLIRRFTQSRKLIEAMREAGEVVEGDPDAADEALRKGRRGKPTDRVELRLRSDIDPTLARIRARELGARYVPTGFDKIDGLWRGGIRAKEMAFVLAATGVGKSNMLVWLAASALKADVTVLVYTLEMAAEDWFLRVTSSLSGIPFDDLVGNSDRVQQALKKMYRMWGVVNADIIVRELPGRITTVGNIGDEFDELVDEEGIRPGLLIIDYADLIRPVGKYKSTYDSQGEVYSDLHDLAKEKNIPIWTASQANRQALTAKNVGLRYIADSFKKEMVADFVLALCQSETEREEALPGEDRMRIRIVKARRSASLGKHVLVIPDHARSRFVPVAEDDVDAIDEEFMSYDERQPRLP